MTTSDIWLFLTDGGGWLAFNQADSNTLSLNRSSYPHGRLNLQLGEERQTYEVDFANMSQTNLQTHKQRKLQRKEFLPLTVSLDREFPPIGCAEGVWRDQGTMRDGLLSGAKSGYFGIRWDLSDPKQPLWQACLNPEGRASKSFRVVGYASVPTKDPHRKLLRVEFIFPEIKAFLYLHWSGDFRGWFNGPAKHGIYRGVAAKDDEWHPGWKEATAPKRGSAKGYWRDEMANTGPISFIWNLEIQPPQVQCSISGKCNRVSAKLTPMGLIRIEFDLVDNIGAVSGFVDVDWDGNFHGIFTGAHHGRYKGKSFTGDPTKDAVVMPDQDLCWRSSALDYPNYWKNRVGSTFSDTVIVEVNDPVFKSIQSLLDKTWKFGHDGITLRTRDRKGNIPTGADLKLVRRFENAAVWWRYNRRRNEINSRRGHGIDCIPLALMDGSGNTKTTADATGGFLDHVDDINNEHYLWHATGDSAAISIGKTGFDISLSGTNAGAAFGPGSYFAEASSKSDEYAKISSSGLYTMLVCRVCLGKIARIEDFIRDNYEAKLMAEKAARGEEYDSLVGDREAAVDTYREFILFDGAAIYPEYMLQYERRNRPSGQRF